MFARVAEATGMELRIFFRDQNKDMIAEFRNGDFESIPVAVFYTKDMEYLAHWIERPELADREIHELLGPMYARLRKPDMTDEERAAAREENIAFQNGPVWGNWRQETIREVIALLEKAPDTKRPKARHLRLWYALADLRERAGDVPGARELFERIVRSDPTLTDAPERLSSLGR